MTQTLPGLRLYFNKDFCTEVAEFILDDNYAALQAFFRSEGQIEHYCTEDSWFVGRLNLNGIEYGFGVCQELNTVVITASGHQDPDFGGIDGNWYRDSPSPDTQWQLFIAPLRQLSQIVKYKEAA